MHKLLEPLSTQLQQGCRKDTHPLKFILKLKLKDAKINNTKLNSAVKCLTFSNKKLISQCKHLCDWMNSLGWGKEEPDDALTSAGEGI
jgi:hypothetical protein